MALSEDASDMLWDVSVAGKSWVELAEEDDEEFAQLNKSSICELNNRDKPDQESTPLKVKEEPKESTPKVTIKDPLKGVKSESEVPETTPLKNFSLSYARILQASPANAVLSAEKLKIERSEIKREVKKEPTEFLTEELSLTGHLDDFQLVSPCKVCFILRSVQLRFSFVIFICTKFCA
jgi:hypothetical protein